ncbi:MAG: hypothetical protein JWQ09_73 [Segetibacter sp.]|nr:hypothetical protein [Segetibacter sp.]
MYNIQLPMLNAQFSIKKHHEYWLIYFYQYKCATQRCLIGIHCLAHKNLARLLPHRNLIKSEARFFVVKKSPR